MNKFLLWTGIILIGVGFSLFLKSASVTNLLLNFIQQKMSPDSDVSLDLESRFVFLVYYLVLLCFVFGGLLLKVHDPKIVRRFVNKLMSRGSLFTTLAGFFLIVLFALFYIKQFPFLAFLYVEDGVFETLTAVAFASGAFLMGMAGWLLGQNKAYFAKRKFILLLSFYILAALAFFLISMEEISWGQRIFGWDTPAFLSQVNEQNETSIHNIGFLSRLFEIFGMGTSLLFIPVLLTLLLKSNSKTNHDFKYYLPHQNLFFLTLMIGFVAFTFQGELLEELLGLFAFIYSLKIVSFFKLRLKKTDF